MDKTENFTYTFHLIFPKPESGKKEPPMLNLPVEGNFVI